MVFLIKFWPLKLSTKETLIRAYLISRALGNTPDLTFRSCIQNEFVQMQLKVKY